MVHFYADFHMKNTRNREISGVFLPFYPKFAPLGRRLERHDNKNDNMIFCLPECDPASDALLKNQVYTDPYPAAVRMESIVSAVSILLF